MSSRDGAAHWLIWLLIGALAVAEAVAAAAGEVTATPRSLLLLAARWALIVVLGLIATRHIVWLSNELTRTEDAHRLTRNTLAQLQLHTAMLEILARSADVPLAFHALARRIANLVPCDRVGLALLTEANEFQTYTARVNQEERRARPRPEVVFKADRTAIGACVQSGQPMIVNDTGAAAPEYLDMNVLHTSGFASGMLVPLAAKGGAVGTLNVVSRRRDAFTHEHVQALLPITEVFAVAYVAQRSQAAAAQQRTIANMTELTLGIATEINSALQTIVGHCDLLERGYPDPNLQRDLATVVRQAQRISALLDKMRAAAQARANEAAETVKHEATAADRRAEG